eukprot:g5488.t1
MDSIDTKRSRDLFEKGLSPLPSSLIYIVEFWDDKDKPLPPASTFRSLSPLPETTDFIGDRLPYINDWFPYHSCLARARESEDYKAIVVVHKAVIESERRERYLLRKTFEAISKLESVKETKLDDSVTPPLDKRLKLMTDVKTGTEAESVTPRYSTESRKKDRLVMKPRQNSVSKEERELRRRLKSASFRRRFEKDYLRSGLPKKRIHENVFDHMKQNAFNIPFHF